MEDSLLSLLDTDIIVDKNDEIGNENPSTKFDYDTEQYINVIPTTNDGELAYSID